MAGTIVRKGVKLFIDGKEVDNSLKAIRGELAHATNAWARMTKGTEEWVKQGKKVAELKAIYREHTAAQKEIESEFDKMGNSAKGFKSIIEGIKLNTIAATFGNLISRGIVSAFSFLKNSIGDAFNKIKEFEQANADLAAILGVSRREIKDMTAEARRLGETTQYTASQVTQMQTELAKLGFENTEIKTVTADVLNFATAMDAELPAAAELAGASLRAFGLQAEDMNRVVSTLASGANRSALSFEYFQTAMSTISPVAKSFGFTIEDTTALLGTLSNSGFDASSAATATRNILLNLADANGKLAKALGQPIRSMDDLVPAFEQLKAKGVDLNTTLELTDKRSVAAFNTFLDNAGSIATLRDQVTGMGDDLQKMVDERMNTVEGATKILSSAWEGLMLSFSGSTGIIKKVIDALAAFVGGITKLVTGQSQYQKQVEITIKVLLSLITVGAAYVIGLKLQTLWTNNLRAAIVVSNAEMAKTSKIAAAARIAKLAWAAATALLTGNLIRARAAMFLLNQTIKANPVGLLLSGITAAVLGIIQLVKWLNSSDQKMKEFQVTTKQISEESKKYTEEINKERTSLNALVKAIINTNNDSTLRKNLIKKLKSEYPQFLQYIDAEKLSNEQLLTALKLVNQEYDKKSQLGMMKGKIDAYNSSIDKAMQRQAEIEGLLLNPKSDTGTLRQEYKQLGVVVDFYTKKLSALEAQSVKVQAQMNYDNSLEGKTKKWQDLQKQIEETQNKIYLIEEHAPENIGGEIYKKRQKELSELQAQTDLLDDQMKAMREAAKKTNNSDTPSPIIPDNSDDIVKEQIKAIEIQAALRRIAAMKDYEARKLDEKSFQEALLKIERETIEAKMAKYKEGSDEYIKLQEELAKFDLKIIQDREKAEKDATQKAMDERKKVVKSQEDLLKDNLKKAEEIKKQYADPDSEETLTASKAAELSQIDALETLHNAEIDAVIDYEEMRLRIEEKYANIRQTKDREEFEKKVQLAQFAIDQMNTLLSAYSSYVQAEQDAETAAVEAKYNKQIKAAGKNSKKVEKLEKEKEEELAKVRAEYEDKSFAIQIAQALASTAMAAINAYSSAALVPVVGTVLAPIAAGVATAAGMLQVAAIKKQHDAAKANYYTGGYTPSGRWDEPKGVVHSNEFIANRFATGNPMLRPVFDVIDYAQRNNTIGSLDKKDIARALGIKGFDSGGYVNQTVVNNNTQAIDNSYMETLIAVIDRLDRKLNEPFIGEVSITGRRGIKENMDLYNQMIKNASR